MSVGLVSDFLTVFKSAWKKSESFLRISEINRVFLKEIFAAHFGTTGNE